MKAPFSPYLASLAPGLKELIRLLRKHYEYVSVLATDSTGFQVSISQRAKSVNRETLTTERGAVVRVCRDGAYAEAAFTWRSWKPSGPCCPPWAYPPIRRRSCRMNPANFLSRWKPAACRKRRTSPCW